MRFIAWSILKNISMNIKEDTNPNGFTINSQYGITSTLFIDAEIQVSWQLWTESSQSFRWRTKWPLLISVEIGGCCWEEHLPWHSHRGRGVLDTQLLPRCSSVTLRVTSYHFLGTLTYLNELPDFQHGLGFDASDWFFWFEWQSMTNGNTWEKQQHAAWILCVHLSYLVQWN